jgi:catechol 2,3-dioxygenase-like lactoylglutathione lyase family enzyme
MIDHISLRVSDFQRSKAFYEAARKPADATTAGPVCGKEKSLYLM